MKKQKRISKAKARKLFQEEYDYFARLGWGMFCGFCAGMSHPDVRLDMAPEFDNLLIVTLGRSVYQFLSSKKGKELWADHKKSSNLDRDFEAISKYFYELNKNADRTLPNIFDEK